MILRALKNPLLLAGALLLAGGILILALPAEAAPPEATSTPAAPADSLLSIVTNGPVDVRQLLRNLAATGGLGLQMAPQAAGEVDVHLENVTLAQALRGILDPAALEGEVVDGVLVVRPRGLVTRWFQFDYPVTEREGRGELEVSVNRDESSSSGGGASAGNQNKSHVTSTSKMSIWPQVMEALKVLVFQGAAPQAGAAPGAAAAQEGASAINLSDTAGRSLVVNPMASLVQVTAEAERVEQAAQLLTRMKQSLQRQVAIQVRILEVQLEDETSTGINWETLTGGDVGAKLNTLDQGSHIADDYFQFVVEGVDFRNVMEMIARSGDLRTVSTPRITTLNNQKAVVRVVTEDVFYEARVEPAVITNGVATEPVVNYTAQTVPVGVVLDVTPQVGQDGVITLNVHPTISAVVGIAESPNADTTPVLSIRELDTVGKVASGQTLVIAGLISERTQNVRSGIPLLKDLPLLGALFGRTYQQKVNIELVMLLTPVILDERSAAELAAAEEARIERILAR